jgi:hypothetical protein
VNYCTWVEGGPALLPDTDLVGFVAANGRPLGIYFRQTLLRIPEIHGTVVDIWGPRRLRYEIFPTATQLQRLECFASGEQMAELFKDPNRTHASRSAHPVPDRASSSALAAQSASPVPAHLRGLSLGVQSDDQ